VALVGSYELLMVIIRSAQIPPGVAGATAASDASSDGAVQARAGEAFADEVATGYVPSVRAIRARLPVA
jgi:hypothetical protein